MLGDTAGRSSGNPTRVTARRRMSIEERAHVVHMKDDPQEWTMDPTDAVEILIRIVAAFLILSPVGVAGVIAMQAYVLLGGLLLVGYGFSACWLSSGRHLR